MTMWCALCGEMSRSSSDFDWFTRQSKNGIFLLIFASIFNWTSMIVFSKSGENILIRFKKAVNRLNYHFNLVHVSLPNLDHFTTLFPYLTTRSVDDYNCLLCVNLSRCVFRSSDSMNPQAAGYEWILDVVLILIHFELQCFSQNSFTRKHRAISLLATPTRKNVLALWSFT